MRKHSTAKSSGSPRRAGRKNTRLKLLAAALFFIIVFASSILLVYSMTGKTLTVEAGSAIPPAADFLRQGGSSAEAEFVSGLDTADTSVPGRYELRIRSGGKSCRAVLVVADTTPPAAQARDAQIWLGETMDAADFAADPEDVTPIVFSYKQTPDFAKVGTQPVTVVMTDTSGNKAELSARLTIMKDTEAPFIAGAGDQSVYLGESISYKAGVTVTDNRDADVALEIDNSAVNPAAVGDYEVIYSATDSSGNRAEVRTTLSIKAKPAGYVSLADLNAKVDKVLGQILKPGMSDLERISEIFYWIADHIDYTGTSDKSDWIKGAYLGITRGTGDCFNYYATARALLTRAGYECIPIERIASAKTRHYWNLVKYNGQYYHFDPLPQLAHYHYVCLLRTDAEVAAFSATKTDFYVYDKTGIPASATEPLDIERKVIIG